MGNLRWTRVAPRALDDRADLAIVYKTDLYSVMFSDMRGQLYKTEGGDWFAAYVIPKN